MGNAEIAEMLKVITKQLEDVAANMLTKDDVNDIFDSNKNQDEN